MSIAVWFRFWVMLGVSVWGLWPSLVLAQEGFYQWSSQLFVAHDENYSLVRTNERQVQQGEHRLALTVGSEAERYRYSLSARNSFRTYRGDIRTEDGRKDLGSSHNPFFLAQLDYDWSEKSALSVETDYQRDTTSADEYLEFFGRIFGAERDQEKTRKNINLNVSNSWQLDKQWQLIVQAGGSRLNYKDADNTSLLPYDYWSSSVAVYRLFSETITGYSSVGFSRFRPQPADSLIQRINAVRTDTVNVSLGMRLSLSEIDSIDVSLGYRESDYQPFEDSGSATEESENGGVFSASYQHGYEAGDFELSVSRSLSPSSDGRLLETDRLALKWQLPLSERFEQTVQGNARWERERGTTTIAEDEEYREVRYDLIYRLAANHQLGLGLRYRWFDDGVDTELENSAEGGGLRISWNWTGNKQQW